MHLVRQSCSGVRIDFQATLQSAHEAVREVIAWLDHQNLGAEECREWELVLAEAAGNAVVHSESESPLNIQATTTTTGVEVRVTDHSSDFDWPVKASLPEDDESEHGRGLFIIESLTDRVSYLRGREENVLHLQRDRRTPPRKDDDAAATLKVMTAELSACYEMLANIFRLGADAARDIPADTLAANWLEELRQLAAADFLSLRMMTPDGTQLERIAVSPATSFVTPFLDVSSTHLVESRACISRQDQWFDGSSAFDGADPLSHLHQTVSGVAHPLESGGEVIGVITFGVNKAHWEPKAAEINVVRSLGDFLGTLLHTLRRRDEANHSRLIKRELQIAADIQRSLLPVELPQSAVVQSAGHLTSVGEVGGDFLDGIPLADGGRLFVIADVMGKGVPAALFATAFRSNLHAHLSLAAEPAKLMYQLNRSLFTELDRADMFITAQLAYLSPDSLTLRTCGAGHGPLLLSDGVEVAEIGSDGPPLGVSEEYVFPQHEIHLKGITHILMHTDGLSDSTSSEVQITREMLHHWLRSTSVAGLDAWAARDSLRQMHRVYHESARVRDDATFIILARAHATLPVPCPQSLSHASR
ncbi:MAG: SpoIIE family protein phosphatase [Prosthecobacter sp.]|jgi:anti-sigma regulatory factor (Ser/Thr protein kinase)|uniref:SpoIIE family protein phosphatase n=1 Tax=Prosthecobacter sp. TaxID=1965333 RepID=UPI0019EB689F|nr:SpoIIE family protein phosphatase [Prosthecobacter sp.]MBE2286279.1 SpoIIE family protein phosphatase [Prosthecobacter sp.]